MKPVFSIIIPTKNEEKVLEKTLRQFESLSIPHECIVSDGKSTDATLDIAKKYADKVAEHTLERRQTIAEGRNEGARLSEGPFLVFIDADCHFQNVQKFFERALAIFTEHSDMVQIVPEIRVEKESETVSDRISYFLFNFFTRFQNNVMHKGAAAGELQLMRKSAFDAVHGYRDDLVMCEDIDLTKRISKVGTTRYFSELTVYHSGRRAHKVGWAKLWFIWIANTWLYQLRGKPAVKEWKVIR